MPRKAPLYLTFHEGITLSIVSIATFYVVFSSINLTVSHVQWRIIAASSNLVQIINALFSKRVNTELLTLFSG